MRGIPGFYVRAKWPGALSNARLIEALAANNILAAERDQARREIMDLQTQLRLALKERDEARALGRCA